MITGKTKSGFVFAVRETVTNDFRVVRLAADLRGSDDSKRLHALAEYPALILGEDGAEKLFAHVVREDGSVPVDAVENEITEIVQLAAEKNKNLKN